MLDRFFHLSNARTTVRTEIVAGATTFLAMAYIVFVQPTVLAAAGMDPGAVLTATCLASAIATLIMAFAANYPIAVAPAMGHNFFFAFTVVVAGGTPWPVALGAVALAGIVFILTAGIGLRERVIAAIPASLKHAISVRHRAAHRAHRPRMGGHRRRLAARRSSTLGPLGFTPGHARDRARSR